jgi:hypothetical protein
MSHRSIRGYHARKCTAVQCHILFTIRLTTLMANIASPLGPPFLDRTFILRTHFPSHRIYVDISKPNDDRLEHAVLPRLQTPRTHRRFLDHIASKALIRHPARGGWRYAPGMFGANISDELLQKLARRRLKSPRLELPRRGERKTRTG